MDCLLLGLSSSGGLNASLYPELNGFHSVASSGGDLGGGIPPGLKGFDRPLAILLSCLFPYQEDEMQERSESVVATVNLATSWKYRLIGVE